MIKRLFFSVQNLDIDDRYSNVNENATVSKLVRPDPVNNQSETERYYNNDRYTPIKSTASPSRREPNDRPIPTTNIYVDPTRRPHHGNARTCVMEINISVNLGGKSSIRESTLATRPTPVRSTTTIQDVHHIDLDFRAPEHVAHLSTDGLIQHPTLENSTPYKSQGKYN